ncbi:MAG TPA: neutral zinc metallopeptidase [Thermoanaerobaculia bacterium]|nr:neutral zinc metallopeptidase [Thermoanaerobaculia bacterium]
MRWEDGRESDQVEDRRGVPGGRFAIGGCGTLIVVLVISLLTGANPLRVLQLLGGSETTTASSPSGPAPGSDRPAPGAADPGRKFVSVVLGSTEDTWTSIFAASGKKYELPTLVLFTDATPTACGHGSAAQGPFYCPLDQKVYLDLGFFDELARMGGAGDFARAYVIAHEVGHHVQQQLGIAEKVDAQSRRSSREDANRLSVRLELQADCLAGVWGNRGARTGLIEPGDAEQGLRAAAAIGDDRLQRMATGRVQPESFTHGSSEQRVEWLRRGLESGDPSVCRTFDGILE